MKLMSVLRDECIVPGAGFADKAEAMREIVRVAKQSPILRDIEDRALLEKLEEREGLGSTGFGNGIAIPHCRLDSVTDFVVGIITIPDGVDFEALDGDPVKLIVFIVAPEEATNAHIKLLSAISQTLLIPGAVKEILAGTTPQTIFESFLRHTRADLDTKDRASKNLFHLFIQDEAIFRDLVHVLAATESGSVVTLDAENVDAYLTKTPLFAGFWSDEPRGFSRIIVAVVEKKLTNETLRRIESITGDLDECSGVLVCIHDIFYSAGELGATA